MFSDINDIDSLNEARANAILSSDVGHDNINAAYQIRKKYILDKEKDSCGLEKISVDSIAICDEKKTLGARLVNGKLEIYLPEFAAAVEASNQVPLSMYPRDKNTFALYFMKNKNLPIFIVT